MGRAGRDVPPRAASLWPLPPGLGAGGARNRPKDACARTHPGGAGGAPHHLGAPEDLRSVSAARPPRRQQLSEEELERLEEACDMALELNASKHRIYEYVESRMSFIAPNLSIIIGASTAAKIMGEARPCTTRPRGGLSLPCELGGVLRVPDPPPIRAPAPCWVQPGTSSHLAHLCNGPVSRL